jgi:hypothetical protein
MTVVFICSYCFQYQALLRTAAVGKLLGDIENQHSRLRSQSPNQPDLLAAPAVPQDLRCPAVHAS